MKDSIGTLYIGQRIRHIRKNVLKLSQVEFAGTLQTSQERISYLETQSRLTESMVKALIYFMDSGINIEWILRPDNTTVSMMKDNLL